MFQGGGALLEEAGAFKEYFEPGPRPARVAINQRGFINQELALKGTLIQRTTRTLVISET